MTDQEREDALDALSDLRRAIQRLEAGESSPGEVARVWADNIHYLSPVLALALPKRQATRKEQHKEHKGAA